MALVIGLAAPTAQASETDLAMHDIQSAIVRLYKRNARLDPDSGTTAPRKSAVAFLARRVSVNLT